MALISYAPPQLAAHMAGAGASQRHSENEHDQAVEMVIFSRAKEHAKCDLDKQTRKSLVPGSWLPGSRSEVRYGDAVRGSRNSYKL